ncbi:ribosome biogenesis GTPase [Desulfocicer vacuolatum DSM 3385]|uniref:Small ribosomal subunit biogenesis GTPase RsgA n=1 Tax=Desulfocicer vacuolatum DSM 3385 TaxID=1121400 RepID=A0A1W2DDX7_9BACT|nr:ribosome small subunit-dependent GTPase A [Desulfocicer vacuolatum]SMC95749.1 ribosome biogenesis GTPase [Desulfocicer vacuolatum DSM 3385]
MKNKKKKKSRDNVGGTSCSAPEQKGVIVAHHGIAVDILFESGERRMVKIKRRAGHVVGDNVLVQEPRLTRLPRRTELRRRDSRGSVRIVGANLDVLCVVVAHLPSPTPGYIDQAMVTARESDLLPVLVINKGDLKESEKFIAETCAIYKDIVDVFVVSAVTGQGLDALEEFMAQGFRSFFVGITGVGKSSLLNAICPELDLRVGELFEAGNRGCNTTTVSTLHTLKGGGELVDTPGFNEFGLVDVSPRDLAGYFPGFEQAMETPCRFRDCRHRTEPGCSVSTLLQEGKISQERYTTYLEILDQLEAGEARFKTRR